MKKISGIILICTAILSYSCENEDVITATKPPDVIFPTGQNPFQEDSILHAAPGRDFTIEATLSDDVGLKSFNILYPDWYLDNTINLTEYYPDTILNEYDLSYHFKVPDDSDEESEYIFSLTATNLGGLSTVREIIVRLDGDYEAPAISNVYPGNNSAVSSFNLRIQFKVQENVKLKFVVLDFPLASVYDSITTFRGGKAYSYDEPYDHLPEGKYTFVIRAVDMFENIREKNVIFTVSE